MGAHTLRLRSQTETEYFWEKLAADGGGQIQCGELKDKFGMPWHGAMIRRACQRVTSSLRQMERLDPAELERAAG